MVSSAVAATGGVAIGDGPIRLSSRTPRNPTIRLGYHPYFVLEADEAAEDAEAAENEPGAVADRVHAAQTGGDRYRLWYATPAQLWVEALPVGNGRLGAMVFGGPARERIQFNEETLWNGAPHAYHRPGAHRYLDEVRSLLFAGNQSLADGLASVHLMGAPKRQRSYQAFGDLHLTFPGIDSAAVSDYRRELDLTAGSLGADAEHAVNPWVEALWLTDEVREAAVTPRVEMENTLVYLERTIYDLAGVFWEHQDILLTDVDRIEVVRGPGLLFFKYPKDFALDARDVLDRPNIEQQPLTFTALAIQYCRRLLRVLAPSVDGFLCQRRTFFFQAALYFRLELFLCIPGCCRASTDYCYYCYRFF